MVTLLVPLKSLEGTINASLKLMSLLDIWMLMVCQVVIPTSILEVQACWINNLILEYPSSSKWFLHRRFTINTFKRLTNVFCKKSHLSESYECSNPVSPKSTKGQERGATMGTHHQTLKKGSQTNLTLKHWNKQC